MSQERQQQIEDLHERARDLALAEVEELARAVLRSDPTLDEFVMGMGTCFLTRKGSCEIIDPLTGTHTPESRALEGFLARWDRVFRLTGDPRRFSANSPVRYDW